MSGQCAQPPSAGASGRCRAGCGIPLDPSLIEPDGDGLHPGCKAPIGPLLPELGDILARYQSGSERSMQRHIGPSEIGVECDRQLAYRMFGVPKVNDDALKWAALVGTWGHAGIADALGKENELLHRQRYLIEQRVQVSPELGVSGVTDCYDTDRDEVIDWKFVGKTSLSKYRRHGPGAVYRVQAHLYAHGWANQGKSPRSVRIVFLPRSSHLLSDGWEWAEPYKPVIATASLKRLANIKAAHDAMPSGNLFALLRANTSDCRYCPWKRPGGTADATGCPGDTEETYERAARTFGDGLV